MNDVIRKVLDLPADSPWPPDHFVLLGISASEATWEQAEAAVMVRMAQLRNYQLAHPDEVTEAMNQLARALVEISRPKSEPQPALEVLLSEPDRNEPPSESLTFEVTLEPVLDLMPESFGEEIDSTTIRLPFQDLRKSNLPPEPPESKSPRRRRADSPVNELVQQPYPRPPWSRSGPVSPRRAAFRTLARYRRLLRAWESAGEFLAQPEIITMDRKESIAVLTALGEIESASWALGDRKLGGQVIEFAQSRPNISALWELPFSTRESLRRDWQTGRQRLVEENQRRRKALRQRPMLKELARASRRARHLLPHATVTLASAVAIVIALSRWKS